MHGVGKAGGVKEEEQVMQRLLKLSDRGLVPPPSDCSLISLCRLAAGRQEQKWGEGGPGGAQQQGEVGSRGKGKLTNSAQFPIASSSLYVEEKLTNPVPLYLALPGCARENSEILQGLHTEHHQP